MLLPVEERYGWGVRARGGIPNNDDKPFSSGGVVGELDIIIYYYFLNKQTLKLSHLLNNNKSTTANSDFRFDHHHHA